MHHRKRKILRRRVSLRAALAQNDQHYDRKANVMRFLCLKIYHEPSSRALRHPADIFSAARATYSDRFLPAIALCTIASVSRTSGSSLPVK